MSQDDMRRIANSIRGVSDEEYVARLTNGLVGLEAMRTLDQKTQGLTPGQQQWIMRNVKQTQRQVAIAIENKFDSLPQGIDVMVKHLVRMLKAILSTPGALFVPEGTNVAILSGTQTDTSIIVTYFRTMDESDVDEAIKMNFSKL